jgi:hypothetical protein
MERTMMSPRRRTVSTLLAMLLVTISFVGADVAYAAAPCYVNNGYINAQDNVSPNLDAPTPNKSWGPYNYTHNLKIAEWCEPGHDWVRDSRIEWSASAVDYIRTHWQRWQDFMIFEQIIASEHQYNNRNNTTASLPYVTYYVADIFEQWSQGYEEAGWWLRSQSQNLVAGQRYYAYAQWDQERSPMTDNWQFLSQAEMVDQWAFSYDGVDPVGKITKKVYNQ